MLLNQPVLRAHIIRVAAGEMFDALGKLSDDELDPDLRLQIKTVLGNALLCANRIEMSAKSEHIREVDMLRKARPHQTC